VLAEADLPDDIEALRALVLEQDRKLENADAEMARLKAMLDAFMRHRFGARSEKLDADQLQLGLEDVETAVASAEAANDAKSYDAAKKILGRKRHAMVDTDGRPLGLLIHPADVQDRDGAVPLLKASRGRHPFVAKAFADSAYNSERVANATSIDVQIVRRIADQAGFVIHPRRWVVERTFAWLGRNRRLAKDFEATIASATAFLYAASAMLLTRRLARSG
jgi:transposase